MDGIVSIEARWHLLRAVLGPEVAALLSRERAVAAIPQLAAAARQWLLTKAPSDCSGRSLAERETTDLEILAIAIDHARRFGGGWDVVAACYKLGLMPDLAMLPKLARAEERYVCAIYDASRALASLAVAIRIGHGRRIAAARASTSSALERLSNF